jgi:hypothetical protein
LLQIPKLVSSLAAVLGFTAAVFYLIERFNKQTDWRTEFFKNWTPDDLPEIRSRKPVSRTEQLFTILFSLFLIIGVTGFGHQIGAYYSTGNACVFIPILKEGFFGFLPILLVRWSLTIVLAAILFIQIEERFKTSIFIIFLNCTDIALAIVFLVKGKKYFFDFEALTTTPFSGLAPLIQGLFIAIFVAIIVLSVYEIAKKIVTLQTPDHIIFR